MFALPAFPVALQAQSSCTNLCLQQVTCSNGGTTSVTGTVYAPNGTDPLPNVLVYIPNDTVAAFTPGVQCLQAGTPVSGSPLVSTNTAVDGTFTLTNVPVGPDIPLVIQAGKWRRQVSISNVNACVSNSFSTRMPQNQSEGDIPQIAIVTGSSDTLECVLRKIGIQDSEFTDAGGTGRIQFYQGTGGPGARIDSSTQPESVLESSLTTLSNYDMVMFACEGGEYKQTSANQQNVIDYANAGGRVFATHFSYVWLYNDSPFSSVATWAVNQSDPAATTATVNTNFDGGKTLAQWLQNAGATTTYGQVSLASTDIRKDQNGVVAPTQSWLNLNDSSSTSMQFTFNTPVGAAASAQCGRVLYNEYHVEKPSKSPGTLYFPNECSNTAMTPQEKVLEYSLFDLSTFVTAVVPPSMTVALAPAPSLFAQGDTADAIVATVANASAATALDTSLIFTFAIPAGLAVTSITSASGAWNCIVATLTCQRTSSFVAGASDTLTATVSVSSAAPIGTATAIGTANGGGMSASVSGQTTITITGGITIVWPAPSPITYGTLLTNVLDAVAQNNGNTVAGSYTYTATPSGGSAISVTAATMLPAGSYVLTVSFVPADNVLYHAPAQPTSVALIVQKAMPAIALSGSVPTVFLLNPVTLTGTVSSSASVPTGTITLTDGGTELSSGSVSGGGVFTYTGAFTTTGTHTIVASYSGDSNFLPITSTTLSVLVEDFSINVATGMPSSATVKLTETATYQFQLAPIAGPTFPSGLALTVTGTSPGAVITFTPTQIAAGGSATGFTMAIDVEYLVNPNAHNAPSPLRRYAPVSLAFLAVPLVLIGRRKLPASLRVTLLLVAGLALVSGATGCGYSEPVRKSYTMTVTATAGNLVHSTDVTLYVD